MSKTKSNKKPARRRGGGPFTGTPKQRLWKELVRTIVKRRSSR